MLRLNMDLDPTINMTGAISLFRGLAVGPFTLFVVTPSIMLRLRLECNTLTLDRSRIVRMPHVAVKCEQQFKMLCSEKGFQSLKPELLAQSRNMCR